MATWTENGFAAPAVVGPVLADAMEQRLNFSTPLITMSGDGTSGDLQALPVLAGTTQFGDINDNVMGLVVNLGGNGSQTEIRPKRLYYWHY